MGEGRKGITTRDEGLKEDEKGTRKAREAREGSRGRGSSRRRPPVNETSY